LSCKHIQECCNAIRRYLAVVVNEKNYFTAGFPDRVVALSARTGSRSFEIANREVGMISGECFH
jgi:hypothetical protein